MSSFLSENESSRINYLETQLGLARREISNLRQKLKALNFMHQKECNKINELLENWRCVECKNKQEGNEREETEGAAAYPAGVFPMRQIGIIETTFPEKRGTPRQPIVCSEAVGKLTLNGDVFTNPGHSLEGLQEFSHIWVLFYFHKNDSTHVKAKVSPPRLNGAKLGVFATRSPHRPSPIGLSLVKIERIVENVIFFSGVDMVDQTPVLDIKPYIPHYDNPTMVNLPERNAESEVPDSECMESPSSPDSDFYESMSLSRTMDGEESTKEPRLGTFPLRQTMISQTPDEPSRVPSGIGEREAPDGEEEEADDITVPSQGDVAGAGAPSNVRVPSWIDQSPVNTLNVVFRDRALFQLNKLGVEGEEKKNIITNVLREDPRSVYLRERWSSHCYVFRISELFVSCKFDDTNHSVTVFKIVQNVEDDE